MSCAILGGYALDCKVAVGGIKEIYINEMSNLVSITESANGYITAIHINPSENELYKVFALLPRGANSFTDNIQTDPAIGTVAYEHTLSAFFLQMKYETSFLLQNVIKNRTSIIVKTKEDKYFLLGKENGMEVNGGTKASGAAMNEFNGYNITFTGMEKTFSQEVNPAIINSLIGIL